MMRKGEFITNINTGKTFKVPHFSEAVRKYKIGVPHSIEAQEDERKVPYLIEPQKDDLGVPYLVCERTGEAFQEAHAGEIIAVHDVFNAPGSTFLFSQRICYIS
ncbi:hypothetical protein MtrunA17_Chr2g0291311 [Medicago truncatula]|uniref:Uncharacterized protein n=1 Tax=Medicago truncatula TaxID=3880 RepID=A0A396J784_MEDTR|nr:hypothetical protein MtrunA17_Chr2g0291311 [Medicago truncatula]